MKLASFWYRCYPRLLVGSFRGLRKVTVVFLTRSSQDAMLRVALSLYRDYEHITSNLHLQNCSLSPVYRY